MFARDLYIKTLSWSNLKKRVAIGGRVF